MGDAPSRPAPDIIERLTPRRRELLELVAKGLTNDEIARVLGIRPGTVRIHVSAILGQLEVGNRTEAASLFAEHSAAAAHRVRDVLSRPAIAVLPLVAEVDDARHRIAARGLGEDLATAFARWCWFPVISPFSTATARTLGARATEIGDALGARFLVDGRVMADGDRLHVTLRVDDARDDCVVWSERAELGFARFYDEATALAERLAASAYPSLVATALAPRRVGEGRVARGAWELAHEGMGLRMHRERQTNARARACFEAALESEPRLLLARFGLGLVAYDAALNQWEKGTDALATMQRAAEQCLELAPHAAEGHFLLGRSMQTEGEWEQAITPLTAAIARNPSFAQAHAYLAQSLELIGERDRALEALEHAVRLGPRAYEAWLGTLHYLREDWQSALREVDRALAVTPEYEFALAVAVASAFAAGELERARAYLHRLRAVNPSFSAGRVAASFGKDLVAVERLATAVAALSTGG